MYRAGFSGGSEQLAVQHGAVVIDGYCDVDVFVGVDPADDSTMRRDLLRSGSYEVTPALTDRAAGVSEASGSPEPTMRTSERKVLRREVRCARGSGA